MRSDHPHRYIPGIFAALEPQFGPLVRWDWERVLDREPGKLTEADITFMRALARAAREFTVKQWLT